MVKPEVVGGLSPFLSIARSEWGGAVTYEASGETLAALRAARRMEADIAIPHPQPSPTAAILADSCADARLGRLQTASVPIAQLENWFGPPALPDGTEVYDLRTPLLELHERIRAHTIEQARLDEVGRLMARTEFAGVTGCPQALSSFVETDLAPLEGARAC